MASFGHSRWAMEQQLCTSRPPLPGAHRAGLGSRQKLAFLWLEFPHKPLSTAWLIREMFKHRNAVFLRMSVAPFHTPPGREARTGSGHCRRNKNAGLFLVRSLRPALATSSPHCRTRITRKPRKRSEAMSVAGHNTRRQRSVSDHPNPIACDCARDSTSA